MTRPDAPLIRHLFPLPDEADELMGHGAQLLEALGPEEIE